jgi:hypothetical protein
MHQVDGGIDKAATPSTFLMTLHIAFIIINTLLMGKFI